MSCWVVVPIKAPDACKTRLAGALSDAERVSLVGEMLRHVVATAELAEGVDRVKLIGPSRHDLPDAVELITDPEQGLNAAASAALDAALTGGVDRLILLPADLPRVKPADIARLAAVDGFGIAPDRAGTGTNALSLPLPQAKGFRFRFGTRSFAAHHIEAERLRSSISIIAPPGLTDDVDLPDDLVLVRGHRLP